MEQDRPLCALKGDAVPTPTENASLSRPRSGGRRTSIAFTQGASTAQGTNDAKRLSATAGMRSRCPGSISQHRPRRTTFNLLEACRTAIALFLSAPRYIGPGPSFYHLRADPVTVRDLVPVYQWQYPCSNLWTGWRSFRRGGYRFGVKRARHNRGCEPCPIAPRSDRARGADDRSSYGHGGKI